MPRTREAQPRKSFPAHPVRQALPHWPVASRMDERLRQSSVDEAAVDLRRVFRAMRVWSVAHAADLGCAVMLILMSLQMLFVISRKSMTCDEIVMIPSGYYHVAAQNFELINDHPPASKILAAIPLLFLQPEEIRPDQLVGSPGSSDE